MENGILIHASQKNRPFYLGTIAVLLLVLLVPGGGVALATPRNNSFERVGDAHLPFLTLYTTGLATGPQLALWGAIERGRILEKCNIRVKLWKTLDDLQHALLAGEGDLWLGHTDVFVEAGLRGAPVQLLLTTGWRKFYLLSADRQALHFSNFTGASLAVTPPGSPAVPVLRSLGVESLRTISFVFDEPQALLKKLVQGELSAALLPEPLVTKALLACPNLTVGENVEDLYGKHTGHLHGMPIAGIAVNAQTAKKYPEIIAWIAKETMENAALLAVSPLRGVDDLPEEFQPSLPKALVKASLQRERVHAAYSHAVKPEIDDYMESIFSAEKNTPLPDSLFWQQ
ncbi:MAG: hypothetical protein CSA21_01420 [Deltaproteobacteria bacterium]|nr:MAG: hypothetical protein CSA21_01420 [Deltaproteobacteria bacterium]